MYGSVCDPGMGPYPPRRWHWVYEPQVGVSTPCGAVSTRETTIFVPGLFCFLYMYRTINHPVMGFYPPRVALAVRTPGWGFHPVGGGIDPGDHRFRPRFVVGVHVRKDVRSGNGTLSSPRATLGLRTPGWGFYIVWGCIDPEGHRFCPRFVGVVDRPRFVGGADVWKHF